ncbi:MAG: dihydroorotate dehydrogenase electron transfer subunit [Candidatus Marinimicrobia bacterium]|nr:dihydroorotate dehydrogenase electron transfer subunit [Candidatus Neomarinimicrobiota bacterium]
MYIENVTISSNEEIAMGIWRMSMNAPKIAAAYIGPGQFINILPNDNWEHPIRRPMSIASVNGNIVEIIYKIFGDMTHQLSRKNSGETINILGPLGNVFTEWDKKEVDPILIGGGVGLAPILNVYESCKNPIMIIGAKTAAEHFMEHDPKNNIYLTTDDGSMGIAGNALKAIDEIDVNENSFIFACGPEPMLHALQKYAIGKNIRAQLSVESYMGCGVGLCQGCVIERQNGQVQKHSYHEKYSLVCLDGPVYECSEVTFG